MRESRQPKVLIIVHANAEAVVTRLPGSHVTPCGSDITWQVRQPIIFPPLADCIAVCSLSSIRQFDLKRSDQGCMSSKELLAVHFGKAEL